MAKHLENVIYVSCKSRSFYVMLSSSDILVFPSWVSGFKDFFLRGVSRILRICCMFWTLSQKMHVHPKSYSISEGSGSSKSLCLWTPEGDASGSSCLLFTGASPYLPCAPCWPLAEARACGGALREGPEGGASRPCSALLADRQPPDFPALVWLPRTAPAASFRSPARRAAGEISLCLPVAELFQGWERGERGGREQRRLWGFRNSRATVCGWSAVSQELSWLLCGHNF